ncbi:sulfur carrier protein ThiS [Alicyclobacillus mengziensis]|uniref:Sulfur carrier protein ThiS n=1 Tax=Alicyclobacillus mengziensis TaxID=2931921 RepID=A0A9X7Z822_9BACL|nr:sulfur carrier protein ThiS [Alicyclobacillus mengziensis]QSO47808.1 sulfur carrier protein ThiS [Alicyclobacillus mengziensis]
MINVTVNGKTRQLIDNTTVEQLLLELELTEERIAVECNRNILDPGEFSTVTLNDRDELEIVRFVGGG